MTFAISGGRAVRVPSSPVAAMRETVTELTRRVEDMGWENLSAERTPDRSPEQREQDIRRARIYRRRSPLAIQGFRLLRDYVLGQGVTLRPADPLIGELVDEFWKDPVNQAAFTSTQAMAEILDCIYTDGDAFLLAFPDEQSGTVQLGTLDALDVVDWIGMPGNWRVPMWYKARKPRRRYDFNLGQFVDDLDAGPRDFVWYREFRNTEDLAQQKGRGARFQGPSKVEPGLLIHLSRHRRGKFGEPDLGQAALDYLKAHKEFLDNRATLNRAAAAIAWRQKLKGGQSDVQRALDRVRSAVAMNRIDDSNPRNAAGGYHVENEASTLEWMKTDTGGASALNDERILRMYVGSAIGVMNHYFGDEASANLATATAMELPMLKHYEGWQQMMTDAIRAVLRLTFETANKAGRIGPEDKGARKKPSAAQDALAQLAAQKGVPAQLGAAALSQDAPGAAGAPMAEADKDDHFYGAWSGGSKASGGHPAAAAPKQITAGKTPAASSSKASTGYTSAKEEAGVKAVGERLGKGTDKYETAALVNQDGELLSEWSDKAGHSVNFSKADEAAARDAHILHNHPGWPDPNRPQIGTPAPGLSRDDVDLAMRVNARGIQAWQQHPDVDGKRWRYELIREGPDWGPSYMGSAVFGTSTTIVKGKNMDRIDHVLSDPSGGYGSALWQRVVDTANATHSHEVMTMFAEEMRKRGVPVTYRRTEW